MSESFHFHLGRSLNKGTVAVGIFYGRKPSLAAATTAGRVLVHNPHERAAVAAAAAAAAGGQETPGENGEPPTVSYLNINRDVTALAGGKLRDDAERDTLVVGSGTSLLAYDVEENQDLFYREVPDGANAVAVGRVYGGSASGGGSGPLALVGGNCSIVGFDADGTEVFWTVCGDNVNTMAFASMLPPPRISNPAAAVALSPSGEGGAEEEVSTEIPPNAATAAGGGGPAWWSTNGGGDAATARELVVGSDDYGIRCFRGEEQIREVYEADRVTALASLGGAKVGFAIANGTVGVYDSAARVWRVKSKHDVNALVAFDLDADGVPELVSGLSNGSVVVRRDGSGEVLFKRSFAAAVADLVVADYRRDPMNAIEQIVVCAADGEVRGFMPANSELGVSMLDEAQKGKAVDALQRRKTELLMELHAAEAKMRSGLRQNGDADGASASSLSSFSTSSSSSASSSSTGMEDQGVVPQGLHVDMQIIANPERGVLDLVLSARVSIDNGEEKSPASSANSCLIHAVVVLDFDGGLFGDGNESRLVVPRTPAPSCSVPICPRRNVSVTLRVAVHVGASVAASQLGVVELSHTLPTFCQYTRFIDPRHQQAPHPPPKPSGRVTFTVNRSLKKVAEWLNGSFVSAAPVEYVQTEYGHRVCAIFTGVDPSRVGALWIEAWPAPGTAGLEVTVSTNSMEVASEVVLDLCRECGIMELTSSVVFERDIDELKALLKRVKELNQLRVRTTGGE
jgi:Bardet-Biedl syndrome 2 protein